MGGYRLGSVKKQIISLRDVEHRYGKIHALQAEDISIINNDLTAIVGPNGGGKSTLLKIMAGIIKPLRGDVFRHTNAPVAYLPQNTQIDRTFPMLVEDVVAMGLWHSIKTFGRIGVDAKRQIKESLELVGLRGFEKRSLYELSGGQLQRMLFARLAIQDAKIMFLDEPFAAVDAKTTKALLDLIKSWHKSGKTIVIVLHNIPLVRQNFPKSLLLARHVYGYGSTNEVLTQETMNAMAFEAFCSSGSGSSKDQPPEDGIYGGLTDV